MNCCYGVLVPGAPGSKYNYTCVYIVQCTVYIWWSGVVRVPSRANWCRQLFTTAAPCKHRHGQGRHRPRCVIIVFIISFSSFMFIFTFVMIDQIKIWLVLFLASSTEGWESGRSFKEFLGREKNWRILRLGEIGISNSFRRDWCELKCTAGAHQCVNSSPLKPFSCELEYKSVLSWTSFLGEN